MGDNYVSINMVILGNEGHGKSSFGNFILNQQTFAVSRAGITRPRRQCYGSGNRSNFALKVVDMPACPVVPQEQLQSYSKMIGEVFDRCEDKLHLFLLVIKFENENTGNCLQVFDNWRHILGADIFANWGVIVMTFGDEFTRSMEENQTPNKKFIDWCRDRGGGLLTLFEECRWRIVLVDDTADLDQKERTFEEFSDYMRDPPHPYSKNSFKKFTKYLKVLALQGERPDHTSDIQKKMYSLRNDLMCLRDRPSTIGLIAFEERLEDFMKRQTLLSEDENNTLSQWKRDITDVKCKMSKTNIALVKNAAGKMLGATKPRRTWRGLLSEHGGTIIIVALAIVCIYLFAKQRK